MESAPNELEVLPKALLLQYQRDWVNDPAPLKLWVKARQIGYSFTGTLGPTLDCLSRKTLWIFLSAGQRQSLELARKAKDHLDAMREIELAARNTTLVDERYGLVDGVEITQTVITVPHTGARMIFLPANPDTARGYSGNVMLDEFAFHKDAKKIYAAMYPSITRGYGIHIGSTPFGESGMFYDLATKKSSFSVHTTDIFRAVRDGLAHSVGMDDEAYIKMLRDGCPDEDIWDQEYCCKFISDATSYIPWELIQAAESIYATTELPLGFAAKGDLYLGVDIGRKKDLTAIVLLEKIGDVYWVRCIIRMRGKKFSEQRAVIEGLMRTLPIRRLCQDNTGIGMQLAEELQEKFGSRVEPVTFTTAVKEDLAVRARRFFEDRKVRTPDDRGLRSAVHAIRRIPTAAGHFRFDAERSDAGHADEFWALSLAMMAADGTPVSLGLRSGSHSTIRNMRGLNG
ncbi:terminase large subunit domain-containing protein [Granulicella cerasi]|uniref:Terminase large subunit domain-containing protein n=1 Tax=Granulicella cerasi TaxID=741063 RepID=A0ABW1ZB87_9BACT|nr:terminase family protein [Granulicella cerasi]